MGSNPSLTAGKCAKKCQKPVNQMISGFCFFITHREKHHFLGEIGE